MTDRLMVLLICLCTNMLYVSMLTSRMCTPNPLVDGEYRSFWNKVTKPNIFFIFFPPSFRSAFRADNSLPSQGGNKMAQNANPASSVPARFSFPPPDPTSVSAPLRPLPERLLGTERVDVKLCCPWNGCDLAFPQQVPNYRIGGQRGEREREEL